MERRVALVTGSTRGIGRAIAHALCAQGYAVMFSGTGAQAPADIPEGCAYTGCDIADAAQREELMRATLAGFGRLDVLVNNAGVAPLVRADLLAMTQESFDRVLGINLRGTFFMCQAAANAMLTLQTQALADYAPRIVNIGSISAYTASVSRGEYCISKAGVGMVTQLFADRLAAHGIPVFEVRPGIIDTDMTSAVHAMYERRIAEGLTPVPRFGKPEDVANAVVALCSGQLDFTAGQVLDIDGGFHLRRL